MGKICGQSAEKEIQKQRKRCVKAGRELVINRKESGILSYRHMKRNGKGQCFSEKSGKEGGKVKGSDMGPGGPRNECHSERKKTRSIKRNGKGVRGDEEWASNEEKKREGEGGCIIWKEGIGGLRKGRY